MRMDIKYIKLSRFLLVFIPFLIICAFLYPYLNFERSDLIVKMNCEKIAQTEDYCSFNCSLISNLNCEGIIKVTHTAWASIYESKVSLEENRTKSFMIQLPRRNFPYWLRAGFYNSTYKYYALEEFLLC